jgi:hypothetical protein
MLSLPLLFLLFLNLPEWEWAASLHWGAKVEVE